MRVVSRLLLVLGLTLLAGPPTQAEEPEIPAFDRPGIGLGTGIVPRGALALELGLPAYSRTTDRDRAVSEAFASEVTLRTGLAPQLELQLSGAPWQRQRMRMPGEATQRDRGSADSLVALKWAPQLSGGQDRWALLASATLARGDAAFSEGRQYMLAASWEHDLGNTFSTALYASHSRGDGARSTTWSPSLSMTLGPRLSAFVEAGFTDERNGPTESVAGAGLAWMWTERVQLDASFDLGLDADSDDLQAGLGLSAYFH